MTTGVKETKEAKVKGQKRRANQAPPVENPIKATPAASETPTLRQEFGISRKMLARMTGLSERTLATWEDGGNLNEASRRAITAVERLLRELAEVIRKEAIATWLATPNEGFGGFKPVEVMERGETDRLWRMIYLVGSGTAS